jgi:hypothetical protein
MVHRPLTFLSFPVGIGNGCQNLLSRSFLSCSKIDLDWFLVEETESTGAFFSFPTVLNMKAI